MSVFRLLLREIQHRKLNFLLALASVVLAVGLVVTLPTMGDAASREMTALLRDMEYNVRILPEDVNLGEYWRTGFARADMPQEYVAKLAGSRTVVVRHLQARLQEMRPWGGQVALLTGLLPEVPMMHRAGKPPMGITVRGGEIKLGYEIARMKNLIEGDSVTDLAEGKTFKVTGVFIEKGTIDDIRVYADLGDVQQILNKPGRINEIRALSCACPGVKPEDIHEYIRADIRRMLPGTHVVRIQPIADARLKTRRMDARLSLALTAAAAVACCLWVGLLALGNVHDRRAEIGVLRAMGVSGAKVAALFLGKAVVLGLAGAALGFAAGMAFSMLAGPAVFHTARARIRVPYSLGGWVLLAAPLLCALASYLPAMLAVAQDPADVLREE